MAFAGLLVCFPLRDSDFRALDYYNTAVYLMELGMPEKALEQAQKGINHGFSSPDLFFMMGNAHFTLGKTREAVTAYETAIHLKPSHASAHYNLAVVWMSMNRFSEAEAEAALVMEYDSNHPRVGQLLNEIMRKRALPSN